ncbi:hypothetical protein B0H11DRAFT_2237549 [Mycena galericulata]|nr:hypothetical protein B0H11DRAFT_2237549 [Mycena galericulata]
MAMVSIEQLATWVATIQDVLGLHRVLRSLSPETLFAIAVLDHDACNRVKQFVARAIHGKGKAVRSAKDIVSRLPTELTLAVITLFTVKERVRFSQTSSRNNAMCALLLHHETAKLLSGFNLGISEVQLMLVGTGTIMSGSSIPLLLHCGYPFTIHNLDFCTPWGRGEDVVTYMCRVSGYIIDLNILHDEVDGVRNSWILRNDTRTITVIESMTTAHACIFYCHITPLMGFWDGNSIFHAYPSLTSAGISLTTPHQFVLDYTIDAQRHVWQFLHKYVRRGFQLQFEYTKKHICGHNLNCPVTLRTTADAACLRLYFPESPYRTKDDSDIICWTLSGTGCEAGMLGVRAGRPLIKSTEHEG